MTEVICNNNNIILTNKVCILLSKLATPGLMKYQKCFFFYILSTENVYSMRQKHQTSNKPTNGFKIIIL